MVGPRKEEDVLISGEMQTQKTHRVFKDKNKAFYCVRVSESSHCSLQVKS